MKQVPIVNTTLVLQCINFLPFNMTATLQRLLTLKYDSKDEAPLLNYFHTPLYHFIRRTKQPAPIKSQSPISFDRTAPYLSCDKTQLTISQCKHIARLHMQVCHYTLHGTAIIHLPGRRCEKAQNIFSCGSGFHNLLHINLLLPHYCSSLNIAGVMAGIQFD